MRKYIKLITIAVFTLFLFSCSNENQTDAQNDTVQSPVEEVEVIETQDNESIESKKDNPPTTLPEETDNTDKVDNQEQKEDANDFRGSKWGMSMEEVIASEPEPPVLRSDNTLDFETFMVGMQTQIGYTFEDDKLIRAGFFYLTEPDTKNGYIEKYKELKELLIEANGKPALDTIKQKNTSQKIDEAQMGDAICNGDALYASQWILPRTNIQLLLRGEDSKCHLTIVYLSKEALRNMLEERLKKENQGS